MNTVGIRWFSMYNCSIQIVSSGIAPVTEQKAMCMLESLKAFPILKGTRGDKSINFEALCRLISRASQFACENTMQELDLNPVFCTEKDVFAGDAQILIDD